MKIWLKLAAKGKAHIFLEYKNTAFKMSETEFSNTYKEIEHVHPERDSSLNEACMDEILKNVIGPKVLDAGCGNGYLADRISKKHQVTASDIVINRKIMREYPHINFKGANIEKLPFGDGEFDTVICTHTLEHVQNIFQAICELRRVAKKRVIIVVPKQRPYRYTFDLHLHFFPYPHSLLAIMGTGRNGLCREMDGDLFYIEDIT